VGWIVAVSDDDGENFRSRRVHRRLSQLLNEIVAQCNRFDAALRGLLSLYHCCVESKRGTIRRVKYWEIIADNLSKVGLELGLRFRRGLLQTNVLFRLGAVLLFPFLFLQSLLGLPLLGLPPRDDEMVVFAVAPPGTRRHIPRLDKLPIGRVRRLESEVIADCGRNIQPSPIVQIWLWPFILEHVLEMIRAKWAAVFPLRVASAIFLSNSNPAILAH